MDKETQVLGKCPCCGGDIVENERAYGCVNWRTQDGGCKFRIWKTIAKRPITPSEAKALLEDGETEVLDGFVSKSDNPFSAKLVLNEENAVVFKFPPRK